MARAISQLVLAFATLCAGGCAVAVSQGIEAPAWAVESPGSPAEAYEAVPYCPLGSPPRFPELLLRDIIGGGWPPPPMPSGRGGYTPVQPGSLPSVNYPLSSVVLSERGLFIAAVLVGTEGQVLAAEVVCGPPSRLDKAILDALTEAKFTPATVDGAPIVDAALQPFDFRIRRR